jgi:hypothetical protein
VSQSPAIGSDSLLLCSYIWAVVQLEFQSQERKLTFQVKWYHHKMDSQIRTSGKSLKSDHGIPWQSSVLHESKNANIALKSVTLLFLCSGQQKYEPRQTRNCTERISLKMATFCNPLPVFRKSHQINKVKLATKGKNASNGVHPSG